MDPKGQAFQTLMNSPEGQAALHGGSPFGAMGRLLTLAVQRGVLSPADVSQFGNYSQDASGAVGRHDNMPTWAKIAMLATAGVSGGALLAPALAGGGAAGGGATAASGGGVTSADLAGSALGSTASGSLAGGAAAGGSSALSGLTIPKLLSGAGVVGRVATGIEQGRLAGRQADTQAQLEQARLDLEAPQAQARNAVRGDVLANVQPLRVTGPTIHTHGQIPSSTGGVSPDLLSPDTRTLGRTMSRNALLQQMNGSTKLPQANGLDTLLNIGGALGLPGAAMDANKRRIPSLYDDPYNTNPTGGR